MTREDEIMNSMREQREDAHIDGHEKGLAIGREEGKRAVAKRMLSNGISVTQIMQFTGLTKEEIAKI